MKERIRFLLYATSGLTAALLAAAAHVVGVDDLLDLVILKGEGSGGWGG